ncbi:MAG: alpha/beta fold hydrolase [Candidatus Dormibacteria bacterium]
MTEWLDVGGRRYACDLTGQGPAVVLLHAAIADRRMYSALVVLLSADHRLLSYDQPGFGETPPAQDPVSPVHDLAALMDAAGMPEAVVVGTSFGSRVAFDAALAIPARVRGIVAAGPGLSGRTASGALKAASEEVDAALGAGDHNRANEIEMRTWVDGVGRTRPADPAVRAMVAQMNAANLRAEMAGHELRELPPRRPATDSLVSIGCPVLAVVGDCDQPHCLETARLIGQRVPGARLVRMAETAHLPSMERTDEFAALVREFVAGLPSPSPPPG